MTTITHECERGYLFPRRCKQCDRSVGVEEAVWANPMGRFGRPAWFHTCGDSLDGPRCDLCESPEER